MKKIIEGKMYDTDTANIISCWSNNYAVNDFNWMQETLYKTKKGAWFLFGEGGANTSYAKAVDGNSSTGGASIIPLTTADAFRWMQEKGDPNIAEEHFAEHIEEA